jgi:retinol dehydrogenase-12
MLEALYLMLVCNWINIIIFIIFLRLFRRLVFYGRFSSLKKSMEGKVIIVTGSSAGIGKETALQLIKDGAQVIFACRNEEKAMLVINSIEKENRHRAHFLELNLSSFKSVDKFVEIFNSKFEKLDILINNAGAFPSEFVITEDKLEDLLQGNVLSQMVLTLKLLDKFNKKEGQIINLASFVHTVSDLSMERIKSYTCDQSFTNIKTQYYNNLINKFVYYANTKIGNIYFTNYLAEYLEKNYPHIKTSAVNPGVVYTEFHRIIKDIKYINLVYSLFFYLHIYVSKPAISGAQQTLDLCYQEFSQIPNGEYFSNCRRKEVSAKAMDKKIRDAFVRYCFDLIKKNPGYKSLEI